MYPSSSAPPPQELLCLKVVLSSTEEVYGWLYTGERAEGSGHCLDPKELDESPVRVEGTNKSGL